ncbi:MAG: Ig-like domain-containing protein [Clostridiales bacterium]|nr:Ig-like domain-containing protein [Clostridiales bacterium]
MKTKQAEQNQIKCKNCGGVYDAAESTCPHCGEETSANLDAAKEGALEVTKYGGGFRTGGGFSRLVTGLLAALLLILVVALVVYGIDVAGEISAQREGSDSLPAAMSSGDLTAEPEASQTASEGSDLEPEVSSEVESEPEVITATGLTLSKTELTLEESGSAQLEATVAPEDWSGEVTWASSDESVAKVDSAGQVTYVASGECTITATADEQTAACAVTCKEPVDTSVATGISLNYTDITLVGNDGTRLVATVTPSGWEGTVVWSSSDESVATVNDAGYVLYVSGGTCTITARAGDITASCKVNCRKTDTGSSGDTGNTGDTGSTGDTGNTGSTSTLTLNETDITLLNVGDGITLKVSGGNGTYTWSSSNTAVATVTAGGSVYAQGSGTCTITVTSGGSSASCIVRVR